MTRLVFVDTETTGLSLLGHEIWEVGAITRDLDNPGQPDSEWTWQLPVDLGKADPMALRINKYYERQGHVDLPRAFAAVFSVLTRGALLLVNNTPFDVPRLELLLRANDACPDWNYHPIDVRDYAAGAIRTYAYFGDPKAQAVLDTWPWSGSAIYEYFGIEKDHDTVHSALGDARALRDLWDAVDA